MKPVLIVSSPYYTAVSEMLTRGATHALYTSGTQAEMVEVPGSFEIPAAIAAAAATNRYSGFVALGCVIRGETTHYDIISNESARGLMELATREKLAIGNGILTCENLAQAERRADPAQGDKGGEAARACLRLIELHQLFGLDA